MEHKFKVGDLVERINKDFDEIKVGNRGIVIDISDDSIKIEGCWRFYSAEHFILIQAKEFSPLIFN